MNTASPETSPNFKKREKREWKRTDHIRATNFKIMEKKEEGPENLKSFIIDNKRMSLISMISESRAERFVRLLQDYRSNADLDYRTLVTKKHVFEEHRKLHALLQQVRAFPVSFCSASLLFSSKNPKSSTSSSKSGIFVDVAFLSITYFFLEDGFCVG